MPTINKPKRNYNAQRQSRDIDRKERMKIYNSKKWKDLRLSALMQQPLCVACLAEGKTALATDCHHLVSFTKYNGNERDAIAYDPDNIAPLCDAHHWAIHFGILKGCQTIKEIEERIKNNCDENKNDCEPTQLTPS